MTTTPQETGGPSDVRDAPGLEGLKGRLCISVKGQAKLLLDVSDGTARILGIDAGAPDATLHCNDVADLGRVLRGEMNAVVAALQGCMYVTGDREFATRVVLGLNAKSPYTGERLGELG